MKIFIVNGFLQSGKSTFEKLVKKIEEEKGNKVKIVSSIDYIKLLATNFGWEGTKTLKDRKMLSELKRILTEWGDVPYLRMKENIEAAKRSGYNCFFIDVREPEEIKRFVEDYNALTIFINRNNPEIDYGNDSDNKVKDYNYDIEIDNSRGLNELKEEAEIFCETFLSED